MKQPKSRRSRKQVTVILPVLQLISSLYPSPPRLHCGRLRFANRPYALLLDLTLCCLSMVCSPSSPTFLPLSMAKSGRRKQRSQPFWYGVTTRAKGWHALVPCEIALLSAPSGLLTRLRGSDGWLHGNNGGMIRSARCYR